MHGLFIQMYVKLLDALNDISLSGEVRQVLDNRLTHITLQRTLRDPVTSRSYRVQKSLFSSEGLTTVDKVCVLFLLPHILGPDAEILPEYARLPVLRAIARAQLCVIASRGLRSYTEAELVSIYDEGYVVFYRNLETLYHIAHEEIYKRKQDAHEENPNKNPPPKRFAKKRKYVTARLLATPVPIMYAPARLLVAPVQMTLVPVRD